MRDDIGVTQLPRQLSSGRREELGSLVLVDAFSVAETKRGWAFARAGPNRTLGQSAPAGSDG